MRQMPPRDKDYIRSTDGLVFNVIGYDHPADRILASLKAVGSEKWTSDYATTMQWLSEHHPEYVDEFICVPNSKIQQMFYPQERLRELMVAKEGLNELDQTAVQLAHRISEILVIPAHRFGLTDSLLWSRGREDSDIDLVVYGQPAASQLIHKGGKLFGASDFVRFELEDFELSGGDEAIRDQDQLLALRKNNLGRFQGARFSVRAVRDRKRDELHEPTRSLGRHTVQATVVDSDESLFFPVVYELSTGHLLVSFDMSYETVLRVGERVEITGVLEQSHPPRIVISGIDPDDRVTLLG